MKVELLDSMGNDLTVVNAARVSFDKVSEEFTGQDEKLISYLAKNSHWTPFSQVQYQVRIEMPIFVARQWFKHMVGITRNEVSRRYVDDAPTFYVPEEWRGRPVNAKQGSSDEIIDISEGGLSLDPYERLLASAKWTYNYMLHKGVCPEQARMVLPQSMYTTVVETGSLAAAARVAKQRLDGHAQLEIQELAKLFESAVEGIAPVSWKHLMEN